MYYYIFRKKICINFSLYFDFFVFCYKNSCLSFIIPFNLSISFSFFCSHAFIMFYGYSLSFFSTHLKITEKYYWWPQSGFLGYLRSSSISVRIRTLRKEFQKHIYILFSFLFLFFVLSWFYLAGYWIYCFPFVLTIGCMYVCIIKCYVHCQNQTCFFVFILFRFGGYYCMLNSVFIF